MIKIGTRVRVLPHHEDSFNDYYDDWGDVSELRGVVVAFDNALEDNDLYMGVDFKEEDFNGHDLNGCISHHTGWWCHSSWLEVIDDKVTIFKRSRKE